MSTLTEIVVLGTVLHFVVLAVMIWIRVRRTDGDPAAREKAQGTPCAICGQTAVDWRYDGLDPYAQVDSSTGRAWSADLAHYRPLCAEHLEATPAEAGLPVSGR